MAKKESKTEKAKRGKKDHRRFELVDSDFMFAKRFNTTPHNIARQREAMKIVANTLPKLF